MLGEDRSDPEILVFACLLDKKNLLEAKERSALEVCKETTLPDRVAAQIPKHVHRHTLLRLMIPNSNLPLLRNYCRV